MYCTAKVGGLTFAGKVSVFCELSQQEAMGYGEDEKSILCFRESKGRVIPIEVPYRFLGDIKEER